MTANWLQLDDRLFQAISSEKDSAAHAAKYFDGRPPDWRDIVERVPATRKVVTDLVGQIGAPRGSARVSRVVLILGPSGEGKTTALMQVAHALATSANGVVLWRPFGVDPIADDFRNLPADTPYYIFSDDAEEIAQPIYEFLASIQRPNVTFVLAARAVDWSSIGGRTFPWRSVAGYREVLLSGLDEDDASLIVDAWDRFGEAGLLELSSEQPSDRPSRLLAAVHEGAASGEGALLGGMLTVRYGELFKDHIRMLLRGLAGRQIGQGRTLASAILYAAAAHTQNLSLSPNILAEILDMSSTDVRGSVLLPLQDEAVLTTGRNLVRTRHARIADAILDIAEDFNADVAALYAGLTRSAIRVGRREFIAGYEGFTYLCRRLEIARPEAAVATAREALNEDPKVLAYVHNLAHVLRINDSAEEASGLCEHAATHLGSFSSKPHHIRAFYYEWASAEGASGNPYLSIWLSAISLSDLKGVPAPSSQHVELALAGIGGNMLTLADNAPDLVLRRGVRAAESMGRKLSLSVKAASFFRRQRQYADRWEVEMLPMNDLMPAFREALEVAWGRRERQMGHLPGARSLSFRGISVVLGLQT